MLSKDEILAATDLAHEDIEVPEWGGTVRVQEMSGTARDAYEDQLMSLPEGERTKNLRARLAAFTLVNEEGDLMFSLEETSKLGRKSAKALDRVFAAAVRLNKLGDASVEEAAKN